MFRDYNLYRLRKKRDEAEKVAILKKTAFSEATARSRRIKQLLASWERINTLLCETLDPVEKEECLTLLASYPTEVELREKAADAREKVVAAEAEYVQAQRIYTSAAQKAREQKTFNAWVRLHFGGAILGEIRKRRLGPIDLIFSFNKAANKLDVYFGGKGFPLGSGHAHWVFNQRGHLVYSRKPVKV